MAKRKIPIPINPLFKLLIVINLGIFAIAVAVVVTILIVVGKSEPTSYQATVSAIFTHLISGIAGAFIGLLGG